MDKKITLGQKIWELAKEKAFTKVKFAKELDIARETLYNWIDGETDPGIDDLKKMSKLLGVPVTYWYEENHSQDEINDFSLELWQQVKDDNKTFKEQNAMLWKHINDLMRKIPEASGAH